MADSLTITLAGPPMGKERVRVRRATGHLYTPERTLSYEARVAQAGQLAMGDRPLYDGPMSVVIEVYYPVAKSKPKNWLMRALAGIFRPVKKPDWDNVGKICSDALNMIVWVDDAQIVDGRVIKWYSANPRTVISIAPVTQPEEGVFA